MKFSWSKLACFLAISPTIATPHVPVYDILNNHHSWHQAADDVLSILAGYHVIYSWPGGVLPDELLDLTRQGKVGGVIIFGENVNDDLPAQIQQLQDVYRESPGYLGFPLLITTDQEGGVVARLPGGPEETAKEVGSSPNPPAAAASAGAVAAQACKAYNVNGNLAPVLDVYREEGNFDDEFGRSFSMDPAVARACGAAFLKAQQSRGVVATTKHWPGLGAAAREQNTDLGPVTLDVPLTKLRRVDELPFRGAIAAGVEMIMPSWAVYPALDPERPSGLSKKWLRSELRGRLGYEGVIISDALEAGALEAYGNDATRGVLAVQAGVDIALASGRHVSQGEETTEALVEALKRREISPLDFAASTRRVLQLRSRL